MRRGLRMYGFKGSADLTLLEEVAILSINTVFIALPFALLGIVVAVIVGFSYLLGISGLFIKVGLVMSLVMVLPSGVAGFVYFVSEIGNGIMAIAKYLNPIK